MDSIKEDLIKVKNKSETIISVMNEIKISMDLHKRFSSGKIKVEKLLAISVLCGVTDNDLTWMNYRMKHARSDYEKNMFKRLMSITMYEFLVNKCGKLLNAASKESLDNQVNDGAVLDFKRLNKKNNKIQTANQTELKKYGIMLELIMMSHLKKYTMSLSK